MFLKLNMYLNIVHVMTIDYDYYHPHFPLSQKDGKREKNGSTIRLPNTYQVNLAAPVLVTH